MSATEEGVRGRTRPDGFDKLTAKWRMYIDVLERDLAHERERWRDRTSSQVWAEPLATAPVALADDTSVRFYLDGPQSDSSEVRPSLTSTVPYIDVRLTDRGTLDLHTGERYLALVPISSNHAEVGMVDDALWDRTRR